MRWALCILLVGCGGAQERPACAPEALALIEAAYVSEVLRACSSHETPEACPEYKGIRAKFHAKRAEWEKCGP
jgi:hypothetical protein